MPGDVTMPTHDALRGPSGPLMAGGATPGVTVVSRGTGRVRHEDKITVYISRDELLRLEQARLILRAEHGLAADRGRIVREAVAAVLDDLDARGANAELLQRLVGS